MILLSLIHNDKRRKNKSITLIRNKCTLTLNPLYHSFIAASSYFVCDLRKSISSLLNLSLLPKQPILKSTTKNNACYYYYQLLIFFCIITNNRIFIVVEPVS